MLTLQELKNIPVSNIQFSARIRKFLSDSSIYDASQLVNIKRERLFSTKASRQLWNEDRDQLMAVIDSLNRDGSYPQSDILADGQRQPQKSQVPNPHAINIQEPNARVIKALESGDLDSIRLEDFNFSLRTSNCLKKSCIFSVQDFAAISPSDFKKQRSVGQKVIDEILPYLNVIRHRRHQENEQAVKKWCENTPQFINELKNRPGSPESAYGLGCSEDNSQNEDDCQNAESGQCLDNSQCADNSQDDKFSIPFFYRDGMFYENVPLKEMDFTPGLGKKLMDGGFYTSADLFGLSDNYLKAHRDYTDKMIETIRAKAKEWEYVVPVSQWTSVPDAVNLFIILNVAYLGMQVQELYKIVRRESEKITEAMIQVGGLSPYRQLALNVYRQPEIGATVDTLILKIISQSSSRRITIEELKSKLPEDFSSTYLFKQHLYDFYDQEYLKKEGNYIEEKRINIKRYMETLPESPGKTMLRKFLDGKNHEQIAAESGGVTKQYISESIIKLLNKRPELEEDKYLPIFEKYNFDKTSFCRIFNETEAAYQYLSWNVRGRMNKRKPLASILESNDMCTEKKDIAAECTGYIKINGQYVLKQRDKIVDYLMKCSCRKSTTLEEFMALYNSVIETFPPEEQEKIRLDNRYFDSYQDKNVLKMPHKIFKYYNFADYDFAAFYAALNLAQYNNMEISSWKIFNDNMSLMEEYNIKNGFELYTILKTTWSSNQADTRGAPCQAPASPAAAATSDTMPAHQVPPAAAAKSAAPSAPGLQIDFVRNPTLIIGNGSREKQIYDLFQEASPITSAEFARLYEKRYGVRADTFLAAGLPKLDFKK